MKKDNTLEGEAHPEQLKKFMISTELLKLRRKELGLTQTDAANKMSIGRSQYCNIEIGNASPSIPVLIELIKLFDISFEELYGIKPSKRLLALKKKKIAELKKEVERLESEM